jgi:V8-like Glu-specific endopeptidase
MTRALLFLVLLVLMAGRSHAETASPLRALMTGDESRGWHAVGRLNIGKNSFCTGSLIAPDLVLTAAHCLYDADTGKRVDDASIEFLADWRNGRASAYRKVRRSIAHPDFTFTADNFAARVANDLAILELDQPIRNTNITPFAVQARPEAGDAVGVVSYAQDRADSPSLQELCHVLARQGGSLVLSCSVNFGSSGAPIFVMENGKPAIVSLVSAKAMVRGKPVALGTSLQAPLQDLLALRAESDGVFTRTVPKVRRLSLEASHATTGAKFLRP